MLFNELYHRFEVSLIYCYYQLSQIPHSTARKLLSTVPPPESNMLRVDFRSNHVHYLNNLEEDAMYKRWRNNLNEVDI